MAKFADHFEQLYLTHFAPLRSKYDPLIAFPDIGAIRYPNPLNVILHAITENNPHFHIVTPEELNVGFDPLWEFQRHSKFKAKHSKLGVFLVNDKTVWIDYGDKAAMENSFSRHCVKILRPEQIGGIIKFQYSKDHYHDSPVPVFPFLYPGYNDYRTITRHYPAINTPALRAIFEQCCADDSFECNLFARWAGFSRRNQYDAICADIPGADISNVDRLQHPEYLRRMSTARFALSIRGNGQFSHREIEAIAIGVPLLYEDRGQSMIAPLIPDHHYIKITPGTLKSKLEYYLEHYDEALAIAKRARDYYDTHFSQAGMQNAFKKIVDMILTGEAWIEH